MGKPTLTIKFDISELANILYENLTDDQLIGLMREWDEMSCSWDFTHKAYMYFRSTVNGSKDDYREYLEDFNHCGPTIEKIFEELENI